MLSAIALDGNNGMFPSAFAVAEAETKESWTWFSNALEYVLGRSVVTSLSDRQKGLVDAVERVFPYSPHHFCVLHV